MSARPIYITASGQHDNVGDTALRRALLDRLVDMGPLHVGLTRMPPGYVAGLGLAPGAVRYADGWDRAVLRSSAHDVVHVANPGEVQIRGKGWARVSVKTLLSGSTTRVARGRLVVTGIGLAPAAHRAARVVGAAYRTAHVMTWRDVASHDATGVGGLAPDWAFALGGAESAPPADARDLLVLSLRFDRTPPTATTLDVLARAATALDLRLVVVPQTARDDERAATIADALGVDRSAWGGDDLRHEEERVREVHRRAAFVISDRLHALVIGSTEGALPVELVTSGRGKVPGAFAAAGIDLATIDPAAPGFDAPTVVAALTAHAARRAAVVDQTVAARRRLDDLTERIRTTIVG